MPGPADSKGLAINADIVYEGALLLKELARELPNETYHRLYCAVRTGNVSPVTQERVQLECCFITGSALGSSKAAYLRFLDRLNGALPPLNNKEEQCPTTHAPSSSAI